jgi:hypothetical protein
MSLKVLFVAFNSRNVAATFLLECETFSSFNAGRPAYYKLSIIPLQSSVVQHGITDVKTPAGVSRNISERERKIGHRRVGADGEITYKKVRREFQPKMSPLQTDLSDGILSAL